LLVCSIPYGMFLVWGLAPCSVLYYNIISPLTAEL